jgi:carbamoyltransferase
MITLALHPGRHDASAVLLDDYRLLGAVQMERLNRDKGAGVQHGDPTAEGWAWACADELLSLAGLTRRDIDAVGLTRAALPRAFYRKQQTLGRRLLDRLRPGHARRRPFRMLEQALRAAGTLDADAVFDTRGFLTASGLRPEVSYAYVNHHRAHALPALFLTDWEEALLYTSDGGGDNEFQSARSFRDGRLSDVLGGDALLLGPNAADSLGLAYGVVTELLGFRMMRHEGKVTGLAAYGAPRFRKALGHHFAVDEDGRLSCDWPSLEAMRAGIRAICDGGSREDIACSIQDLLEDMIVLAVRRLLARHPHKRLGLSGGVFANVKLNRRLAEDTDVEEIFVVPPMGDEGLALGAGLEVLLRRDGMARWLDNRYRLDTLYLGRDHGAAAEDRLAATPGIAKASADPLTAARCLAAGEIGAIYCERMEFGPRALGARTILANPSRRETHDELNRRLSRTEFMPFAPVVLAERAAEVFDITAATDYACRFMTITTGVKPEWREKIAAVVHIDHSARPQTITRAQNPLYYDILRAFAAETGTPVLVNTSFNVHEEPIVNRPEEAIRALTDGRVDFLVTPGGLWRTV